MGDHFVGSHGLAPGGPEHGEHPYTVVGVLKPTASVLDRVILTPTADEPDIEGFIRFTAEQVRPLVP